MICIGWLSINPPQRGKLSAGWQLLALWLLFPSAWLHGETAVPHWVRRYIGADGSYNSPRAIASDAEGNVLVTGVAGADSVVLKYSGGGDVVWAYHGNLSVSGLALDSSGNVFVTGARGFDFATVAFSSGGSPLWTNLFIGPTNSYDGAQALAVGSNGLVYVTGHSQGDYLTLAYSHASDLLWTNRFGDGLGGRSYPWAIAVGTNDQVYVTGYSAATNNYSDFVTVAYSSTGSPLWTNRYNGPANGNDEARALAVDLQGNVFVTGSSERVPSGSSLGADYLTIAYSGAGKPLWTNRFNGPSNLFDSALAIAADPKGNVFVTGYANASMGTKPDCVTLGYNQAGLPLWTNFYDGPSHTWDIGMSIVVDPLGTVFVGGYSDGGATEYDLLLLAYSSAGTPLWTNRYNGPSSADDEVDSGHCLAVGSDGALYIAGHSDKSSGSNASDWLTIKYAPPPPILFSSINRLASGLPQLTITAPTNIAYRLEASANLASWLVLTNFSHLPGPSIQYTDTLGPAFARRFYRAVWTPQ